MDDPQDTRLQNQVQRGNTLKSGASGVVGSNDDLNRDPETPPSKR